MRMYKFRIYPTKRQEQELNLHLRLSKNLWNELLAHNKQIYQDYGYFATKNTMQRMAKGYGLFAQTQQVLTHRLNNAIMRYLKLKKREKKCGFPRFKSIDRMSSLKYPQYGCGFKLGKKLKVNPFGEIQIKKHREIEGKIKTLTLKKMPTGKWFACFCVEQEKKIFASNKGEKIGIDLGLRTFATLSNGTKINNPKHFKLLEKKLADAQRQTSRKKRGSHNRKKAKFKATKVYEKISNNRSDFLHKLSHQLVNNYSFIALEKLQSQKMAEQNYGKSINDAGWNMFANMITYKAESAGCEVVFVDPKDTTKTCCKCGYKQDMPLSERIYYCPVCNTVEDRDVNAAKNILAKATVGMTGSNACEDDFRKIVNEAGKQQPISVG